MKKWLTRTSVFFIVITATMMHSGFVRLCADITNKSVGQVQGKNERRTFARNGNDNNPNLNVKEYGAKSDGETNDAPAIQSAINAMPSTGGTLLFPHGNYYLGSTVKLDKPIRVQLGAGTYTARATAFNVASNGVEIIGSGSSETFFKSAGTGPLITNSKPVQGLAIKDMFLTGSTSGMTASGLIDLNGVNSATIENISSSGGTFGVHLAGIFDVWVSRLVISRSLRAGLFVDGGKPGQSAIQSHFYDIDVNQGLGDGVLIVSNGGEVDANTFMNVTAEDDRGIGFHILDSNGSNSYIHCETADERGPEQWYIQSSGNSFFYSHAERTHAPASIDYVVKGNNNVFFYIRAYRGLPDGIQVSGQNNSFWYPYIANAAINGIHVTGTGGYNHFYSGKIQSSPIGIQEEAGAQWDVYKDIVITGSRKPWALNGANTQNQIVGGAFVTSGTSVPTGGCHTGTLFLNTTGHAGTTLFVCEGNRWVAK